MQSSITPTTRTRHGVVNTDVALVLIRDQDNVGRDSVYDLTDNPDRTGVDTMIIASSTGFDGAFDVLIETNEHDDVVGIEVVIDVAEALTASRSVPDPLTPEERDVLYGSSEPPDSISDRADAYGRECDAAWDQAREQHLLTDPIHHNAPTVLGPITFPSGTAVFDGPATSGPQPVTVNGTDWVAVKWHYRPSVEADALAAIAGDRNELTRIGVYRADHAPKETSR